MNKSWFYVGAIGTAILLTSCGSDTGKPAAPAANPAATAPTAPAPTAAVPPTTPAAPTATAPTKPTVAATTPSIPGKSVSVDVAAGLIPPTNGDSWAKTVSKGRPDPFATLAIQPIEVIEKDPITGTPVLKKSAPKIAANGKLPTTSNRESAVKSGIDKPLPTIKVAAAGAAMGKSAKKGGNSPIAAVPVSGVNKSLPKITFGKPAKAPAKIASNSVLRPISAQSAPSKLPGTAIAAKAENVAAKPLQAMAIEVSGVIEVEGRTQVIVKLPNESFSRYVEVGDRIANGKVLVKRVEGRQTLAPIAILEEVGVEVSRRVGDKVAAPAAAAPAAAPAQ
jgi:hypothetical protein